MTELLTKKSVLDIFQKYYDEYHTTTPEFTVLCSVADDINDLPPVNSDEKSYAQWIPDHYGYYICSNCCGDSPHDIDSYDDYGTTPKFCNNCGSPMRNGS